MQLDITDIIAAIAAVVAGVSAVASMLSAIASMRQVRLMREELDKRERPYIYGHFQDINRGLLAFVLENKGSVAAVNVKSHFEEPAPTMHNGASLNSASIFRNSIAFFPPGASYSVPVALGKDLLAEGRPTEFRLALSYQTPGGREFDETIAFDLSYLGSVRVLPPTAADVLGDLKKPLDKIGLVMEWWRNEELSARVMGEMGLGGDEGGEGVD